MLPGVEPRIRMRLDARRPQSPSVPSRHSGAVFPALAAESRDCCGWALAAAAPAAAWLRKPAAPGLPEQPAGSFQALRAAAPYWGAACSALQLLRVVPMSFGGF